MHTETRNGVTVTVTNEHAGRRFDRWIISTVVRAGVAMQRRGDKSFATQEEATEFAFHEAGVA